MRLLIYMEVCVALCVCMCVFSDSCVCPRPLLLNVSTVSVEVRGFVGGERESGLKQQASKEVVLPYSVLLFTLFYSVCSLLVVPRHIRLRHWTFVLTQTRESQFSSFSSLLPSRYVSSEC